MNDYIFVQSMNIIVKTDISIAMQLLLYITLYLKWYTREETEGIAMSSKENDCHNQNAKVQ